LGPEAAIVKELVCAVVETLVESQKTERAPAASVVSDKGHIDWAEFFSQFNINALHAGELFKSNRYASTWTKAYVDIRNEHARTPHGERAPGKVPKPESEHLPKDDKLWSDLLAFVLAILIRVGVAYASAKLTFIGLSWFLF
jgi:hypothetical protein